MAHVLTVMAPVRHRLYNRGAFVVKEECRLDSACLGRSQRRLSKAIEGSDDGLLSAEGGEQTPRGVGGSAWEEHHQARRSGAA